MRKFTLRQTIIGLLLFAAGAIAGAAMTATREARAEIGETPRPQALQSGGQQSIPVLKEIAATLHQMDSRLARLEALAQKMQTPLPNSPLAMVKANLGVQQGLDEKGAAAIVFVPGQAGNQGPFQGIGVHGLQRFVDYHPTGFLHEEPGKGQEALLVVAEFGFPTGLEF
jgi:TolA-binding protein